MIRHWLVSATTTLAYCTGTGQGIVSNNPTTPNESILNKSGHSPQLSLSVALNGIEREEHLYTLPIKNLQFAPGTWPALSFAHGHVRHCWLGTHLAGPLATWNKNVSSDHRQNPTVGEFPIFFSSTIQCALLLSTMKTQHAHLLHNDLATLWSRLGGSLKETEMNDVTAKSDEGMIHPTGMGLKDNSLASPKTPQEGEDW